MKKTIKRPMLIKVIGIVAVLLLLISFNIFNVFAETTTNYVAEVNSVKYEKYTDAWSAVSNGGTINMLGDWTINKALTVNENKTVTINMNGFMINRGLSKSVSNGEVIYVKSGAVLNINGEENSTVEHAGTIQGDMWHYNQNGNHVISGALITGGYSSNGGGAIHIKKNAQVNITNVTIAGNASSDGLGSGAIRVDSSNGKLTITDSDVCYNKSNDGGGAITVDGEDSKIQIIGTKIYKNVVTGSGENGGAIQINYGTVTVSKSSNRVSEISFNSTTKNGGAIYVSNGNLILDDSTVIARNIAGKEGGAIYIDSGADNVEIKGVFAGNSAKEEGGAIYVNSSISGNKGAKISNAEFLGNNSLLHGGAIYVDSDNNISMSGKVVAIGNSPNNLYVQKNNTIASNNLTDGSRVGLTTSWDATKSSTLNTSNYKYFVSDKQGYEIAGDGNTLYYVAASSDIPDSIKFGDYTYPINKGSFVYDPTEGGQNAAYYYYSDGYFADSAKYYNEHLVTMSSCVAIAAASADYTDGYSEEKASGNIVDLFTSAGFTNIYVHYPEPEFYGKDSEILSTIGYVIASRETSINGKSVTLIAIAVRGGGYGAEWASNVTIGDGVLEARGFNDAANQVEGGIYNYIREHGLNPSDSKFWISGFSRAAATSNLVAKRLTDSYGEDDVYAYCFETPKGGVNCLLKDGLDYANIHNVINATDIVPFVATTEMGFIRYGVDHILPLNQVGSDEYKKQKEKMLSQLAAVAPSAVFNDYFNEATISYVGSTIEGWFTDDAKLLNEIWWSDYKTAADWNTVFIKKLQEYSLTNNVSGSIYNKDSTNWYGYRNYWSTYKWYLYEDNGNLLIKCYEKAPSDIGKVNYTVLTIEDSIANIMNFYFTADSNKKNSIVKAIDLDAIMAKIDMTGIYSNIIGEWNGFSIEKKNKYFNEIWNSTQIEAQLHGVITPEEIKELKTSFYVVLDFLLDFVGDDYDYTDQNLLGTLMYNVSNILQTHNFEVLYAWARSYDSFYASGDLVSPPVPPKVSLSSGTYNSDISVQLISYDSSVEIYYTLDGTVPNISEGNYIKYYNPIKLAALSGKSSAVTIKAISVCNGVASEVVTYNYVLNTNAEISVNNDAIRVYNFDESAYLILAEYDGDVLQNIKYFQVSNNSYISLSDTNLNFDNTVVAYLVRDFDRFNPLCDAVCLTDPYGKIDNINLDVQNVIVIESFEAKQAENPEFIKVTFSTNPNNAEFLVVALFEKNSKSDFNNVVYFSKIEKNEDNTYTFTVKRSRLQEMLGGSVNNSALVLTVAANGIPEIDSSETTYNENVYTITYHLNGGINNPSNPKVFTLSSEAVLSNPTKEHYRFVGWYDNGSFMGSDIWVIVETSKNVDLYAKWEALEYSVVYTDGVDDVEIFENKVFYAKYNSKTPEFGSNPIRDGYTFVGWDKEISSTVLGDSVYKAVWSKNHVHEPVFNEGKSATCAEPGYASYFECENCGYFENENCTIQILDIEVWKQTVGKITVEHTFTEQIRDKAHLVIGTGINCHDPVRYYHGCTECDAIGTSEWMTSNFGEHKMDTSFTTVDGQHYHACLQEGCDYTSEKIICFGGEATCTNRAVCIACEKEYGELIPHTPCEDDGDCTTAIVCSCCGEEVTHALAEHNDENGDGKCDECGRDTSVTPNPEPGTETETETESESESTVDTEIESETENESESITDGCGEGNTLSPIGDKKLPVGAIIAISVIGAAVVGCGSFSLIWFGIKKKTLAELLAIFKKG